MPLESILVDHLVSTEYADLPPGVVECTKLSLLDTLGTALAGRESPGCSTILEYVLAQGGPSGSTLWGWGQKTSPEKAALVNGMTAHALDLDDTFVAGGLHTGAVVIPAAVAMAQKLGQVEARPFLAALAVGIDLACRLSLAARDGLSVGLWPTGLFSTLGAVAAAGKILQLDAPTTLHALGIGYSQLGGNRQAMLDGALTKRLQCGLVSSIGVISADLAQRGITGATQFLSGPFGLFKLYGGKRHDPSLLTRDLGRHFLGSQLLCKMYPCCSGAQGPVQATLEILKEHSLQPEQVQAVHVMVPPEVAEQLGHDFELGDSPQAQAQFNLKYLVSAALIHGRLGIDEIEEDQIRTDRAVLEMTPMVAVLTSQIPQARNVELPVTVEIQTRDGAKLRRTLERIQGDPSHPEYARVCRSKFDSCLGHAGGEPLAEWGQEMAQLTLRLDRMETLEPWFECLERAPLSGT